MTTWVQRVGRSTATMNYSGDDHTILAVYHPLWANEPVMIGVVTSDNPITWILDTHVNLSIGRERTQLVRICRELNLAYPTIELFPEVDSERLRCLLSCCRRSRLNVKLAELIASIYDRESGYEGAAKFTLNITNIREASESDDATLDSTIDRSIR